MSHPDPLTSGLFTAPGHERLVGARPHSAGAGRRHTLRWRPRGKYVLLCFGFVSFFPTPVWARKEARNLWAPWTFHLHLPGAWTGQEGGPGGERAFLGPTRHRSMVSGAENIPFPSLSLNFVCKILIPAVRGGDGGLCALKETPGKPWSLIILGSLGRQEASSQ